MAIIMLATTLLYGSIPVSRASGVNVGDEIYNLRQEITRLGDDFLAGDGRWIAPDHLANAGEPHFEIVDGSLFVTNRQANHYTVEMVRSAYAFLPEHEYLVEVTGRVPAGDQIGFITPQWSLLNPANPAEDGSFTLNLVVNGVDDAVLGNTFRIQTHSTVDFYIDNIIITVIGVPGTDPGYGGDTGSNGSGDNGNVSAEKNYLLVSGRTQDWHAVDILRAGLQVNDQITVEGRTVVTSTPAIDGGSGAHPWWLSAGVLPADEVFTFDHILTSDNMADEGLAQMRIRTRCTSDFLISNIVIERAGEVILDLNDILSEYDGEGEDFNFNIVDHLQAAGAGTASFTVVRDVHAGGGDNGGDDILVVTPIDPVEIFRLSTYDAIQNLLVGATTSQVSASPSFQDSGDAELTIVASPEGGNSIRVYNRAADWHTIDFINSGLGIARGGVYEITVSGRVEDAAAVGNTVEIMSTVNWERLGTSVVAADGSFELTVTDIDHTFFDAGNTNMRFTIQSNDISGFPDFMIDEIVVTKVAIETGGNPVDDRLGVLFQLSTLEHIQELEVGFANSAVILDTPFLSGSENPQLSIVDSPFGTNAILVDGRTQPWAGIDLMRHPIGITAGNKYSIEFIGRFVDEQGTASIEQADNPWLGLETGVADSDGSFHVTWENQPSQLGQDSVARAFRMRTAGNTMMPFIIDDIIVTRLALGEDNFDPEAGLALALEQTPLHETWADYFKIGNIFHNGFTVGDDRAQILAHHFNSVTAENYMKPDATQPQRGTFNFAGGRRMVEFAEYNNMQSVGHTLVWHSQNMPWVNNPTFEANTSREEAIGILKDHITATMNAFPEVLVWDVLNEAIVPNNLHPHTDWRNQLRDTVWLRLIGPEYIQIIFEHAHSVNPNAVLLYNDYNEHIVSKATAINAMVAELRSQGVPIHGIGMQGHYSSTTRLVTVANSINLFRTSRYTGVASHGLTPLEIHFTEIDITFPARYQAYGRLTAEGELLQAQMYAELMQIIRANADMIERVTFWGMRDSDSWRAQDFPVLFNADNSPKLAFFAVQDPDAFLDENPLPTPPDRDVRRGFATPGTPASEFDPAAFEGAFEFHLATTGAAIEGQASGIARVLFDDEDLHVLLDVNDATVCSTHYNPWERDSVEVFVSMFNTMAPQYHPGDYQLRVGRDGLETAGSTGMIEGFRSHVVNRNAQGYIVQMSFPLYEGIDYGSVIGFDLQINNAHNGSRLNVASWNNINDTNWSETLNFGELLLGETEAVGCPADCDCEECTVLGCLDDCECEDCYIPQVDCPYCDCENCVGCPCDCLDCQVCSADCDCEDCQACPDNCDCEDCTDRPARRLRDPITGVIIDAPRGAITRDTTLRVIQLPSNHPMYILAARVLGEEYARKIAFDISLRYANGFAAQPQRPVQVYIPVPEDFEVELLSKYFMDENGNLYEFELCILEGEYYVRFETDHFSVYLLAEQGSENGNGANNNNNNNNNASPATGDDNNFITLIVLLGASAAVAAGTFVYKKRVKR